MRLNRLKNRVTLFAHDNKCAYENIMQGRTMWASSHTTPGLKIMLSIYLLLYLSASIHDAIFLDHFD